MLEVNIANFCIEFISVNLCKSSRLCYMFIKKKKKVDEHKHLINCIYKCSKEKQVIQNSKKIGCPTRITIDPNDK